MTITKKITLLRQGYEGRIGSLITFLLLTTTFNSHGMETPQKPSYTTTIRNILRGRAPINALWQRPRTQPGVISTIIIIDPFPFTDLPKDMQNNIIRLLSLHTTADSLQVATFTINSLAQVNHELNELINDPEFCLAIIKQLAKKFNCSDQTACAALKTKEANRRLELQIELFNLCYYPFLYSTKLKSLINDDVDLSFTYNLTGTNVPHTPLMIASIVKGGILQQLCALYPDLIDINQQNSEGTTALMIAIENDEANVKILLDAGADPEIANNNGTTPLNAAEVMGNENVINLIKEAIDKKHGRQ